MYGYKCFNQGLINRYGHKFEMGKTYHAESEIKFGNNGNGFHICTNLEDTLRYFDAFNNEVDICLVCCYGDNSLYNDEYYGYYDMYAFEYMKIIKKLSREEIFEYAKRLSDYRLKRFISLMKLTQNELEEIKNLFKDNEDILKCILYYQENKTDVYALKK